MCIRDRNKVVLYWESYALEYKIQGSMAVSYTHLSGVGEYLKSKNPDIQVIAVEPKDSAILSTGKAGSHKIQGIGAGFIPQVLNTKIYDEIITVSNEDAFQLGKEIGHNDCLLYTSPYSK